MRKKRIILVAGITVMVLGLTGCNDKKVVYNKDTEVASNSDSENYEAGTTLKYKLGIGDTSWKEVIETEDGTVDLKVKIIVPEVENMYTLVASKKYLTNDDKKRIMETIVDADSIIQSREKYVTKEEIAESIQATQNDLAESELDEIGAMYLEKYIEYLQEQYEGAISGADFTEDAGDYSGNVYEGTKDGETYYFDFFVDERRNRSAFSIERKMDGDYVEPMTNSGMENKCKYTEDEAKEMALSFCEKLGLPDMQVVYVSSLEMFSDGDIDNKVPEGYQLYLVRDIEGVSAVGQCIYYNDLGEEYSYNDLPYSREVVTIGIDSKGLLFLRSTGLLTDGELKNPVHLLGMEQIKEVVRQNLSNQLDGWYKLELKYLRIKDGDKEDSFCFLPTWVYMYDNYVGNDFDYMSIDALYINAIDGTVIDIVEDGAFTMQTSKIFLEYE